MVPGIVIGGDKKQSEKARLRKGITILACTPGRLLDHLQSTQSFRVDNLRWLVLDEADRLLELGFEQTLKSILELLDSKGKAGKLRRDRQGVSESAMSVEFPQTSNGRQTILCSATLPDNVRQLANQSLDRPITFNAATTSPTAVGGDPAGKDGDNTDEKGQMYSIPSQLEQTCIITPAKLRLVTLISLLKIILRDAPLAKILVFMSNCDSVDYYQHLIATATELNSEGNDGSGSESSDDDDDDVARVIKRLSGKPKSDKKPKFADKQKPPKSKRDNFKKNKANQEDEEDPIWLPSVMLAAGD
ncbi:ATP-dependent RNA helicase dbp7, partial [Spiromyces aspiralis]